MAFPHWASLSWPISHTRAAIIRWSTLAIVVLSLATACQNKVERIVYEPEESTAHGAYVPFARSADPRVDRYGGHHEAPPVAIGTEASDQVTHPYVPIAASRSPLVRTGPAPSPYRPIYLANERSATPALAQRRDAAAPQAQPSPTVPARYSLGTGLGTPVPGDRQASQLPIGADDPSIVSGSVDSIVGETIVLRGSSGLQKVKLSDSARLEREGLGRLDDLLPGSLVGVVQAPGGPADTVRLYSKGQGMPRPGIVPMVGASQGHVTVFGTIVTMQFGGMLVNTGTETMSITLPPGITVLKPLKAGLPDLAKGTPVIATGNIGADGVLTAASMRLTSENQLVR